MEGADRLTQDQTSLGDIIPKYSYRTSHIIRLTDKQGHRFIVNYLANQVDKLAVAQTGSHCSLVLFALEKTNLKATIIQNLRVSISPTLNIVQSENVLLSVSDWPELGSRDLLCFRNRLPPVSCPAWRMSFESSYFVPLSICLLIVSTSLRRFACPLFVYLQSPSSFPKPKWQLRVVI